MTIDQLLYFITVVKNNSITKTSQEMYVSQPAVSLAIKSLENELGVTLFLRNNNKLVVTNSGKHLFEIAKPVVDQFQEIPRLMAKFDEKNENMTVCIPPMLGVYILPQILESYIKQNPYVHFEIQEKFTESHFKLLKEGKAQIAISVVDKPIFDPAIDYAKIGEAELFFCVHKNHPLAQLKVIRFEDIQDMPLLLLQEGSIIYQNIYEIYSKNNLLPKVKLQTNQLSTIHRMLKYGNSGSFLLNQVIEHDPDITAIRLAHPIKYDILLTWKKEKTLDADTESLIKYIIDYSKRIH